MIINRDNCEAYFLDFSEGRLSPELESELKDFLRKNPDLAPLLDEFDPAPIPLDESITFQPKQKLKKNIRPTTTIHFGNYEEWMISSMEGILDEDGQEELREFIRHNPALETDYRLYLATRLSADHRVVFPGRAGLKKPAPIMIHRRTARVAASVAALLLLLLTIRVLLPENDRDSIPVEETAGISEKTPLPAHDAGALPIQAASLPDLTLPLPETSGQPGEKLVAAIRSASFRMVDTRELNSLPRDHVPPPELEARLASPPGLIDPAVNSRPLVARFFTGLINKTRQDIRNNNPVESLRDRDVNFWTLASAGIDSFNTLTDRDLELYVERDDNGKIESYTLIEKDRLIMAREMNRE